MFRSPLLVEYAYLIVAQFTKRYTSDDFTYRVLPTFRTAGSGKFWLMTGPVIELSAGTTRRASRRKEAIVKICREVHHTSPTAENLYLSKTITERLEKHDSRIS